MANRNIDVSIRKPRRAKGTPFFFQRNIYSLGVILFGGVSWYLYELWPETAKLKKSVQEGKFKYSEELQEHVQRMRLITSDPELQHVISKVKAKQDAPREEPKSQPWLSKILSSTPDL